ncbi:MAG: FAD-dependent oxidoreductase [Chitinophagaceae bacterium]
MNETSLTTNTTTTTTCCIAGGGPAGMMLGFLLARAGIDVIVLEKHKDFFRDFRGDTIHPSTFELVYELGLLEDFLKIPHQELQQLGARFNERFIKMADFSHLRVAKPALGFMPQWDFLNFLREKAIAFKNFRLLIETKFSQLLIENNKIKGVTASTPGGMITIHADLVVGADGRDSSVREQAGLKVITTGAPIDVLWFKLSKQEGDPLQSLGNFYYGKLLVMLDRTDYWQCGYVIPKGNLAGIRERGLPAFYEELGEVVPFLKSRMNELKDWEQVKLLSVAIDHLDEWCRDGLLCIGDAAHAMSPVGGVGINLAIQDAVAAANILYKPLKEGKGVTTSTLRKVQQRRKFPARVTQRMQVAIQKGIINGKVQTQKQQKPPMFMRMLNRWPRLRRLPARLIGMGVRPEHIRTPAVKNN